MKGFLDGLIALGHTGLFLAAILDGAGLPIPGGVDALVVFLATRRPEDTWWFAAVAVLGSTLGNFFLFLLARRGGDWYLRKRASSARAQRFRRWFDTYGLLTVFISALVPLPIMPMKIFVLSAGALGSSSKAFLAAFLGARIPRYLGLAYLGMQMGDASMQYLKDHVWHLTGGALALFLFLALLVKWADRRHRSSRTIST